MAVSAALIVHFIVRTIDTHFDANASLEIPRSHHRTQESDPHAVHRTITASFHFNQTHEQSNANKGFRMRSFPRCAGIYGRIMEWLRILTARHSSDGRRAHTHNWLQHFYGICFWNSICPCNRCTISNGTSARTIAVGMRALRHETCTVRNSVIRRNRTAAIWMEYGCTSTQMTHNVTRSGCFDEFYSFAIRFLRIFFLFAVASCPAWKPNERKRNRNR